MKLVFALTFAAVLTVPLFGASLPIVYQNTKYYNHYGRAIKEYETKCKSKKTKAKAKEKYKKKIEKLKAGHKAEIEADKEAFLNKKADLEKKLKDTDRYKPEEIQKALDNCITDLAKLEAFAQFKDYDPEEAKKKVPAKAEPKKDAGKQKVPAKAEDVEETGDSPF